MDCLVRSGRLRDAVRLIKTSKLRPPLVQATEIKGSFTDILRTMVAWGALRRSPANPVTDLRAALVLASDIGERLNKIASERADIEAEIAQKFPRYYEQIKPRTISFAEVQKLLAANEVLVFTFDTPALLSTPEETFVIVVTPPGGSLGALGAPHGGPETRGRGTALRPGRGGVGHTVQGPPLRRPPGP